MGSTMDQPQTTLPPLLSCSIMEAAASAFQVSLPDLGRDLGRFLVSWAKAMGLEQVRGWRS